MELAWRTGWAKGPNLHVHGLQVSPSGQFGTTSSSNIHPGQTFNYSYRFPTSLPAGTYWYHPHAHGRTAPQVAEECRASLSSTG